MIAFSGGGTGGHLTIIKTLKTQFAQKKEDILYIGSQKGQDKDWFLGDTDFSHIYFLPSKGFGDGILNKFIALFYLIKSLFIAMYIFKKHKITKVISVGGFSSAPSAIIAIMFKIPLYIHEQNAIIGRLNKLCLPFAKKFFCSFDIHGNKLYPYPIENEFFTHARQREELKSVLFLGGSAGASFINHLALQLASSLNQEKIKIIHQTGKNDFNEIKRSYVNLGIKADVFAFSDEIYKKMQQADIAVSRAGATSLWELISNNLPCVFIPYPYAIHNHQYHNANFLSSKQLALLIKQEECTKEFFLKQLIGLNAEIRNISVKLKNFNASNGAKKITNIILKK